MPAPRGIRTVALALVHRDGDLLVGRHTDPASGERFYRPPGGGVEFGESGREAVEREFDEEFGATLVDAERVGVLENRFTAAGERHHEVVLVYEASFADESRYDRETFHGVEDDGSTFAAVWKSPAAFGPHGATLYPDGLRTLL